MLIVSALRANFALCFTRTFLPLLALGSAVMIAGCGGGGTQPSTAPAASSPTFSPAGGTFSTAQSVVLADSTTGATIYYTTDGSTPTTASAKYTAALSITTTQTISAIAAAANFSNSAVAAATYSIVLPPAAAPTFSPAAGTYVGAQTISLADATPGATIYYTLDGSTPTMNSARYAAPFTISTSTTVNAIAAATGFSSSTPVSAAYTINLPAATAPVFSPAPGTFTTFQTVSLSDATAGAAIYYTLDGSMPTVNSTRYTAPLSVTATTTINAIATATGYNTSPVASGTYTINLPPAAAPMFSPAAGTYTAIQTVTLSDTTTGAALYYTLDGSTPTVNSARYSAPLTVSATTTINAIATATAYTTSPVASATFTINLPPAATPVFSPAAGTYTSVQTVAISDATTGANLYYTLDGSTPTTASMRYTTPLTVSTTTTIRALATATGNTPSVIASGTFTINLPPAATPTFSPAAGTYPSVQTVSIADSSAGASIFYTLDGSTPTTASTPYTGPITVSTTKTIDAIATASGFVQSAVASGTFTINLPPAATPSFSTAAGTFTSQQTISISDATSGATIYYTLDGSAPTTASARYTTPIVVASTETISAIATASGYIQSAVATATYTINQPTAATPAFAPAGGTYTTFQTVTISDSTAGSTIYYTLDGSTPTVSSVRYTAPISVTASETIKAIATATGNNNSLVGAAQYVINLQPAATPTYSPAAGTYTTFQTVTLSDTTAGATIYYTLDGSTPTTASAQYTTPLSVNATETINSIATANGFTTSVTFSGTYTINLQPAATPTFTPAPGTYTTVQTVTLADTTANSTIYYTIDGSTPTTASMKYTGPLTVGATETINAIATATGFTTSAVGSGAYTVNLPTAGTPTFSPAGGPYTTAQSVTLADATPGSTIYYTVDGSTPTPASAVYTTPIAVSAASTTINAIANAAGYKQSAVGTATYLIASSNPTVAVTLSTYNSTALLAAQPNTMFGTSAIAAGTDQLIIDENQQFQTVDGFGAAFTEASAINLEQVELPSMLSSTLSDLFTRNGNGIGLSFMLSPMGASDESRSLYTYDDTASPDPTLASFSVAHDATNIIPLIQSAKKLNPSLKYLATPWSPPAWMKIGQSLEGGTINTAYYGAYAQYFIKYLQAYQSYGILPDFISPQNEPLNNTNGYPSMGMDEPTQLVAIRDNLLPALNASGLPTKIMLYDHNWDTPSYPASLLADPTLLSSPTIAGTAWHGYGGPQGAQLGVANQYPTKGGWETEHSGGTFIPGGQTGQFISDLNEITLVMRSASKAYVKWNLALDQNRGPNTTQLKDSSGNSYGGCNTCEPIITINTNTGQPTKTIEYYTIGQFSKFILPGAVRVWSSNTPSVVSTAYINPDGSRVLVAFNNSYGSTTFQVQWGTKNFSYTLSAYAAATFVWSGTQTGTPSQSATQQIQGDSFITATGLEVEETTDDTGSYDLGYVVDGATVYYQNVNFGTGVSSVNVRSANNGTGGTIEFHLDSPTGTLLGTAKIPNTGGYQNWQNVTTPVSSTTGIHNLYLVIHGSGSIGNVNWFQFQ